MSKPSSDRVFGIWDGHDAGVAVIEGGRVTYAANEERFSRRKLEVGFPSLSLREAVEERGVPSVLALSTSDPAKLLARLLPSSAERYYRLRRHLDPPGPFDPLKRRFKEWFTSFGPSPGAESLATSLLVSRLPDEMKKLPIRVVDHHAAHLATAWSTSGFETATVVSLDGVGDGCSGAIAVGTAENFREISRIPAHDSIGLIFEEATRLLGLRELEDEGKVMALASYADLDERSRRALDGLITMDAGDLRVRVTMNPRSVLRTTLWRLGPERFAAAVQSVVEEAVIALIQAAVERTGIARVAVAGGVFANVRVNRLVREFLSRRKDGDLFVSPHMGDGGLALGAALVASITAPESAPPRVALDPYLGTLLDVENSAAVARARGLKVREITLDDVAGSLTAGRIIGWATGRMEYGPRALGARSILARPDDPGIRDRLNLACKKRVFYQPFCPTMLRSEAGLSLEGYDGHQERWMTSLYGVTREGAGRLAGVIGPDRSCRPQIVDVVPTTEEGTLFRDLLRAFAARTGIGALLNTSFNVHGHPLVRTGQDAVEAFLESGLDDLILGGRLEVTR